LIAIEYTECGNIWADWGLYIYPLVDWNWANNRKRGG